MSTLIFLYLDEVDGSSMSKAAKSLGYINQLKCTAMSKAAKSFLKN